MKNAWILRIVVICGFMLLGFRVSSNPSFQPTSTNFLHATSDHADFILAIELEDEVEDVLTIFLTENSPAWDSQQVSFCVLALFASCVGLFIHRIPAFLRFQNLRL
jgi:hypothetical protein